MIDFFNVRCWQWAEIEQNNYQKNTTSFLEAIHSNKLMKIEFTFWGRRWEEAWKGQKLDTWHLTVYITVMFQF